MTDEFLENRIEKIRLVLQRLWDEGVLVREPYKRFLGSESQPLNPPLTEVQIVEFESANGIELPEDYRLFLVDCRRRRCRPASRAPSPVMARP